MNIPSDINIEDHRKLLDDFVKLTNQQIEWGEWFVYHCNTWVPFIERDGDVIQEI